MSSRSALRRLPAALLGAAIALLLGFGVLLLPSDAVLLPDPVPPVEWGVEAGSHAAEPTALRLAAFDTLRRLLLGLAGAAAVASVITSLALEGTAGSRERFPLAVRAGLGAPPGRLLARLVRLRTRPLVVGGVVGGSVGGVVAGGLLAATWPGARQWAHASALPLAMVAGAVAVAATLTLAPYRYAREPLSGSLTTGGRTSDPWEGGFRRILAVLQVGVALGVVGGVAGPFMAPLGGPSAGAPGPASAPASSTILIPVALDSDLGAEERATRWKAILERARSAPTFSAESIAAPGAWSGLGRVDLVVADCGECVRGGLPVPILGEEARHLVVSPGFFDQAGLHIVAGRALRPDDDLDARPVALVSRSFALENFENGDPLGRAVRIGREARGWHQVVGVVEERPGVALGRVAGREPAVYVSVLQHPPDRADLGLTVGAPALARTGAYTADDGLPWRSLVAGVATSRGPPRSVAQNERRHAAPLRWAGLAGGGVGAVALLAALLGVWSVARVEVEARSRDLGVRAALGATEATLRRYVQRRTLATVSLGAGLALPTAVGVRGMLRSSVGSVPLLDPVGFGVLVLVALTAGALGSRAPARAAARTDPGRVLAGE